MIFENVHFSSEDIAISCPVFLLKHISKFMPGASQVIFKILIITSYLNLYYPSN